MVTFALPSLNLRRLTRALLAVCLFNACSPAEESATPPQPPPADEAEHAAKLNESEAARLMALGYVEVVSDEDDTGQDGASEIDPARTAPGLNFSVNAHLCSADLIDAKGTLLRRWSHEPCLKWSNAVLRPDGRVLVIHRAPGKTSSGSFLARQVLHLDWEGNALWNTPIAAHHDLDVLPDGRIAVLTYRHRPIPSLHPTVPVRDNYVALLSPEGELLEEVSLIDILAASPKASPFRAVRARKHEGSMEVDLIHANSIEWMRRPELAQQDPLYAESNFLLCSRSQNTVTIVDWETKRVVWSWGQGVLSGPHDATVLEDGNILIFDNGLNRRHSRVLEVDPRTDEIVWSYPASDAESFFTSHRGAAQRLSNGNTLITNSGAGVAFEVTPAGETVWEYRNPNRSEAGDRVILVRTRRVEPVDLAKPELRWSD
jgi:outer membrane protein assembly factor BamB